MFGGVKQCPQGHVLNCFSTPVGQNYTCQKCGPLQPGSMMFCCTQDNYWVCGNCMGVPTAPAFQAPTQDAGQNQGPPPEVCIAVLDDLKICDYRTLMAAWARVPFPKTLDRVLRILPCQGQEDDYKAIEGEPERYNYVVGDKVMARYYNTDSTNHGLPFAAFIDSIESDVVGSEVYKIAWVGGGDYGNTVGWRDLHLIEPKEPMEYPADPVQPTANAGNVWEIGFEGKARWKISGRFWPCTVADVSQDDDGNDVYTVDWKDGSEEYREGLRYIDIIPEDEQAFFVGDLVAAKYNNAEAEDNGYPRNARVVSVVFTDGGKFLYNVEWDDGDDVDADDKPETDLALREGIERQLPYDPNAPMPNIGDLCQIMYRGNTSNAGAFYEATIQSMNQDGTYNVKWSDGDTKACTDIQLRYISVMESYVAPDYPIGMECKARWRISGRHWPATIASVEDGIYTVDWADGSTDYRDGLTREHILPLYEPAFFVGDLVQVKLNNEEDERHGYPVDAIIDNVNPDGTYDISWDDGYDQDNVGKPETEINLRDYDNVPRATGNLFGVGHKVNAQYNNPDSDNDGKYYDAVITNVNDDGTYNLAWADGDSADTEYKTFGMIKLADYR